MVVFTLDDEDVPDIDDSHAFEPSTSAPAPPATSPAPYPDKQHSEPLITLSQADAAAVDALVAVAADDVHGDVGWSSQAMRGPPPATHQPHDAVPDPSATAEDAAAASDISGPEHSRPSGLSTLLQPAPLGAATPSTLGQALEKLRESQQRISDTAQYLQDLQGQHAALLQVERLLEHQMVLQVLQQPLGYDNGRPVAALLVYRCLLQWHMLNGSEYVPFLEQLIAVLSAEASRDEEDEGDDGRGSQGCSDPDMGEQPPTAVVPSPWGSGGDRIAYWLTATSVLLSMAARHTPRSATVQRSSNSATVAVQELQNKVSSTIGAWSKGWATFRAKVTQKDPAAAAGKDFKSRSLAAGGGSHGSATSAGSTTSGGGNNGNSLRQPSETGTPTAAQLSEDSKSSQSGAPVLVSHSDADPGVGRAQQAFRQALDGVVQKAYGALRDHFKKQVAGLLLTCVQAPQRRRPVQLSGKDFPGSPPTSPGSPPFGSPRNSFASGSPSSDPWVELVAVLDEGLSLLRRQHVPRILIKCLFKQLFGFLNIQLFNQLLLRPECCSTSNARYISDGLKRVDAWIMGGAKNEDYLVTLYTDFKHIRQASSFLCAPNKAAFVFEDVTQQCTALNMQQLYRLCTTFYDDASEGDAVPDQQEPAVGGGADGTQGGQANDDAVVPLSTYARSSLALSTTLSADVNALPSPVPSPVAFPPVAPDDQPADRDTLQAAAVDVADVVGSVTDGADEAAGAVVSTGAAAPAAPAAAPATAPGASATPVAATAPAARGPDMVSGEVLEELRRHEGVTGNGGLFSVTFLLDEDVAPLIAPRGTIVPEVLALIDDKSLYQGMAIPPALDNEECPRSVFSFLKQELTAP